MNKTDQVALVYGLSILGSAAYSYSQGERDLMALGCKALIQGGIIGTGVNVVLWLQHDASGPQAPPQQIVALPNGGQEKCPTNGSVVAAGVNLLSKINPDTLYRAAKLSGVTIGPEGDDPMRVQLPLD